MKGAQDISEGATTKIALEKIGILFSDIVGITSYFDEYGDLAGKKKVETHNRLLFPVIEAERGTVIKTIGDAIMAVFENSQQAVAAAAKMQSTLHDYNRSRSQEEQIHIRIGINNGQAVREGGDVFGDAVNVASRVCSQAGADQILVTEEVVRDSMLPRPVIFHALVTLKGKTEPAKLFRVLWRQDEEAGPRSSPTTALEPGTVIGKKYQMVRLLGAGAMGQVYEAIQLNLKKTVCLKILSPEIQQRESTMAERFYLEARAASRINHPNAVAVSDFGQDENTRVLYLVMEYLQGQTIKELIERQGPLSQARTIFLMSQVLSALSAAHLAGVVHRDLKPANIMVCRTSDGTEFVKVLDFGLAKLRDESAKGITAVGITCGTPEYMSPEQARGEPVDARSDIYSAGVVLYEALTGRVPFSASTPFGVVTRQITDPPPPLRTSAGTEISPALEEVVSRALRKEKKERFQSALEMKAALAQVAAGAGLSGDQWFVKVPQGSRRAFLILGAVVVIILTVVLVAVFPRGDGKPPAAATAAIGRGEFQEPLKTGEAISTTHPNGLKNELAAPPLPTPEPETPAKPPATVITVTSADAPTTPRKQETQPPSTAAKNLLAENKKLFSQKGIFKGDDLELDRLLAQAEKEFSRKRYAQAFQHAQEAKKKLEAFVVDRPLVERKLARFNRLFDTLSDNAKKRLSPLVKEILSAFQKGDYHRANLLLNEALIMAK